jgi:hypothetical protein
MSITTIDTHKLLFGKKGIQDGNVIDMAEHGRVGGVSTGQPYKFTDLVNYAIKLTEDGAITYVAYAVPGTAQSAASWKCMKMDATSGLIITWADGNTNFDNVATDLTTLTYS